MFILVKLVGGLVGEFFLSDVNQVWLFVLVAKGHELVKVVVDRRKLERRRKWHLLRGVDVEHCLLVWSLDFRVLLIVALKHLKNLVHA